jgi:hypothetical protein
MEITKVLIAELMPARSLTTSYLNNQILPTVVTANRRIWTKAFPSWQSSNTVDLADSLGKLRLLNPSLQQPVKLVQRPRGYPPRVT